MKVFIVTITLLFAGIALATPPGHNYNNNNNNSNKIESDNDNENDGFLRFAKMIGYCADSPDLTNCLAIKTITAINRATRSNNIEIIPGVTFTRDESAPARDGRAISENDILTSLPEKSDEKYGRLLDLALKSTSDFINTHNLEVKIPKETTQEIARAIDEGRGKMKKFMGPLMMAVGAKLIAIIPIILGGLALLAFKAIAVAKIAFVLALALGAAKLFGAGGSVLGKLGGGAGGGIGGLGGGIGGYNTGGWNNGGNTGGWSSGGSAAYPYARSIDEAHDMAYKAQAKKQ